jgi:hypothetical protein
MALHYAAYNRYHKAASLIFKSPNLSGRKILEVELKDCFRNFLTIAKGRKVQGRKSCNPIRDDKIKKSTLKLIECQGSQFQRHDTLNYTFNCKKTLNQVHWEVFMLWRRRHRICKSMQNACSNITCAKLGFHILSLHPCVPILDKSLAMPL